MKTQVKTTGMCNFVLIQLAKLKVAAGRGKEVACQAVLHAAGGRMGCHSNLATPGGESRFRALVKSWALRSVGVAFGLDHGRGGWQPPLGSEYSGCGVRCTAGDLLKSPRSLWASGVMPHLCPCAPAPDLCLVSTLVPREPFILAFIILLLLACDLSIAVLFHFSPSDNTLSWHRGIQRLRATPLPRRCSRSPSVVWVQSVCRPCLRFPSQGHFTFCSPIFTVLRIWVVSSC